MPKRLIIATFAASLLLFGTPHGAFGADGGNRDGCGYTRYCPEDNRDGASSGDRASSGDPERYWDCREDPFRDNTRYGESCRYYSECTNYKRCED